MEPAEEFTTIESIFVRHRNALLLRGQFTPIYTDYYLHLMQHGIRPPGELDRMLKDHARHARAASRRAVVGGKLPGFPASVSWHLKVCLSRGLSPIPHPDPTTQGRVGEPHCAGENAQAPPTSPAFQNHGQQRTVDQKSVIRRRVLGNRL
jgi:hypothetical protein